MRVWVVCVRGFFVLWHLVNLLNFFVAGDEGPTVLKSFLIKTNRKWEDWTCMDYDEETGMFALGHEDGMVTLCAM